MTVQLGRTTGGRVSARNPVHGEIHNEGIDPIKVVQQTNNGFSNAIRCRRSWTDVRTVADTLQNFDNYLNSHHSRDMSE